MRKYLLPKYIVPGLFGLVAMTGSLHAEETVIIQKSESTSIIKMSCPVCVAKAEAAALEAAKAQHDLKPGEQVLETREISGHKRIYRIENYLGGAPVAFPQVSTRQEIAKLNGLDISDEVEIASEDNFDPDTYVPEEFASEEFDNDFAQEQNMIALDDEAVGSISEDVAEVTTPIEPRNAKPQHAGFAVETDVNEVMPTETIAQADVSAGVALDAPKISEPANVGVLNTDGFALRLN